MDETGQACYYVNLTDCPYNSDYSQEIFIMQVHADYKNQQAPMNSFDMPAWLKDGLTLLSHCDAMDHDRKMIEAKNKRG